MLEQSEYFDKNKLNEAKLTELRSLVQCSVYYNGKSGWSIAFASGNRVFNGSPGAFAKFLRKLQAKDSSLPRSSRVLTYQEIVNNIMDGKDPIIYIWSNALNNFNKLVYNEEIKESIENKNYKLDIKGD